MGEGSAVYTTAYIASNNCNVTPVRSSHKGVEVVGQWGRYTTAYIASNNCNVTPVPSSHKGVEVVGQWGRGRLFTRQG